MAAALGVATAVQARTSAAEKSSIGPIVNGKTLGTLKGVAVNSRGVLAVGAWNTALCGYPLYELGNSHAWRSAQPPAPPGCSELAAIASDGRGGAWAVGDHLGTDGLKHALAEHYNGKAWSIVPTPTPGRQGGLDGLVLGRNHQVWAVGAYQEQSSGIEIGAIKPLTMVNSGNRWRVVPSPSPAGPEAKLTAIALGSGGRLWAVGYSIDPSDAKHPLIMSYQVSSGWQQVTSPEPPTDN